MTAPDPADAATAPQDAEQGAGQDQDDPRAGVDLERGDLEKALAKARDEAARYRQRAKLAADDAWYEKATGAVAALDEAEQAKRSEVERLSEEKDGLLTRATGAEESLTRIRIALAAGIEPAQVDEFASRLRGADEDELKADADVLLRYFRPQPEEPQRRRDPSQGVGGDATTASPGDALAAILRNA